jgi:hypothetical protein
LVVVTDVASPPDAFLSVPRTVELADGRFIDVQGEGFEDAWMDRTYRALVASEIVQIIGRGRWADRDDINPLEVLYFGDCGPGLPVNRFATLDELAVTPLDVAMAAGVVFTGSKAAAQFMPVTGAGGSARKAWEAAVAVLPSFGACSPILDMREESEVSYRPSGTETPFPYAPQAEGVHFRSGLVRFEKPPSDGRQARPVAVRVDVRKASTEAEAVTLIAGVTGQSV